jgi:hypothetical protein
MQRHAKAYPQWLASSGIADRMNAATTNDLAVKLIERACSLHFLSRQWFSKSATGFGFFAP